MTDNLYIVVAIAIAIMALIMFLIPSISPSKRYGDSTKKGIKKSWKFMRSMDYSKGLIVFDILKFPFKLLSKKGSNNMAIYDDSVSVTGNYNYIPQLPEGGWKYEYAPDCEYKIGDEVNEVPVNFIVTPIRQNDGSYILYIHSPHMPEWYDEQYNAATYAHNRSSVTH